LSFSGLELARRALAAHQVRISVTSHNITNSASEGYSRQKVTLSPLDGSLDIGAGRWLGGGVQVSGVERQRDAFVDRLLRFEGARMAEWDEISTGLGRLETIMQEPSGGGLTEALTEFWEAWEQVGAMPESFASRAALREKAAGLVSRFQTIDRQLSMYRIELGRQVDTTVNEINNLAEQIATLNTEITQAEARGRSTAALCDKRDVLVDRMADLCGVQLNTMNDGSLQVLLGTRAIVDGAMVHPLQTAPTSLGGRELSWAEDPASSPIDSAKLSGRLAGLVQLLDSEAPGLQDRVHTLAETVHEAVNDQHCQGYGLDGSHGIDFFTLGSSSTFSINSWEVNPALETNPELIAAAQLDGGPADGRNAMAIGDLAQQALGGLGGTDPMEYHRGTLAELGVSTAAARQLHENQELITQDLRSKRDAVSGVNMDEELTTLVEAEHAYAAAAKLVRTMDSILDTIVNDIGMAGH